MAQSVKEPLYLGSGDSNLELLHVLSTDLDGITLPLDNDVEQITIFRQQMSKIDRLSTRGFLKFLARFLEFILEDSETGLQGRLKLILGQPDDQPSTDDTDHEFNAANTELTQGSSIYARINALATMLATLTNPRVISPAGRGEPGPLVSYQSEFAVRQIGSARDSPVETPNNFELIYDEPNQQFVIRRSGTSLWSVIKWNQDRIHELIENTPSLQEQITRINNIIGQPNFPTDTVFRSQVSATNMFGWLRYNYEHLSPLERRTFTTDVENVRVTGENIPIAIRFETPSDFQSAITSGGPQSFVELDFNFEIEIPTGNDIQDNWFLSLRINGNEVDVVHVPTSQNRYTLNYEPTLWEGSEDVSIVMGMLNASPTTMFSVLVDANVEWAIGGKIDAASFPSHLLKDPDFGVESMTVTDFINGTIRPLAADFAGQGANFLINTAQNVPLLDTNRSVWFNVPLNGYSRDLQLNFKYALNTTEGAFYIPTLCAFEFEFLDNEGNVKKTFTWIESAKRNEGAGQDDNQSRRSVRYVRDLDPTISLVRWTPTYYAWIDAVNDTTARMQGASDDPRDTNPWDGSGLSLTTGWSMAFTVDLTLYSIEDSIISLRNSRMVTEEFDNKGVVFTPKSATITEAYQMCDKAQTTTNLVNTFLNRGGIFDWIAGTYRCGFMNHGWTKDVTNAGQSLTDFGSADTASISNAGIFNATGATPNNVSQLNPDIIGSFLLCRNGAGDAFLPSGFNAGNSADIYWETVFILGTMVDAKPRRYKLVSGYLDTGYTDIGNGNGSGMKRWGTVDYSATGLRSNPSEMTFTKQYESLDRAILSETPLVFYLVN